MKSLCFFIHPLQMWWTGINFDWCPSIIPICIVEASCPVNITSCFNNVCVLCWKKNIGKVFVFLQLCNISLELCDVRKLNMKSQPCPTSCLWNVFFLPLCLTYCCKSYMTSFSLLFHWLTNCVSFKYALEYYCDCLLVTQYMLQT